MSEVVQECDFDSLVEAPKFKNLLPPLDKPERELLEQSIQDTGKILDPIRFWSANGKNLIVDGYNRFSVAREMIRDGKMKKEDVPIVELHFDDDFNAFNWVRTHAAGRRNMNPKVFAEVLSKRFSEVKSETSEDKPKKSDREVEKDVAEEAGVSRTTVKRSVAFDEAWQSFIDAGVSDDVLARVKASKKKTLGVKAIVKIAKDVDPDKYEDALKRKLGDYEDFDEEPAKPDAETTPDPVSDETKRFVAACKSLDKATLAFVKALRNADLIHEDYPAESLEFLAQLASETYIRFLIKKPASSDEVDAKIATSTHVYQLLKSKKGVRRKSDRVDSLPFKSSFHQYIVKG